MPIVIGGTGIVSKRLNKYLEAIPGKHAVDCLQKKNTCTGNIARNKGSTAIMEPE
jgi:hypothetical protein